MTYADSINKYLNNGKLKIDKKFWSLLYHNLISYPKELAKNKIAVQEEGLCVHSVGIPVSGDYEDKYVTRLTCIEKDFSNWGYKKHNTISGVFFLPNGLCFTDGELVTCHKCLEIKNVVTK